MKPGGLSLGWITLFPALIFMTTLITGIDIDYDCTDVDHIPVLANIALTGMPIVTDVVNCDSRSSKLNWDTLNDSERKIYCDLTSEQLSAISVPDAVHCTNVNCSDPVHIEETTRFYIAILRSLQQCWFICISTGW